MLSCLQLTFHHNPACRTNPDHFKKKLRSQDPDTTLQCNVSALSDSSKHSDCFHLLRCDKKIGFAWTTKLDFTEMYYFLHILTRSMKEDGSLGELIRVEQIKHYGWLQSCLVFPERSLASLQNNNFQSWCYDHLESFKKKNTSGTSLVVQWLRLSLPMQGVWIWYPVGKLRSHMPYGQKTKILNRRNIVTNSIKT